MLFCTSQAANRCSSTIWSRPDVAPGDLFRFWSVDSEPVTLTLCQIPNIDSHWYFSYGNPSHRTMLIHISTNRLVFLQGCRLVDLSSDDVIGGADVRMLPIG
jgi:hypothetical protein